MSDEPQVGDFLIVAEPRDNYRRADIVWLREVICIWIDEDIIKTQPWHTTDQSMARYRRFKPSWYNLRDGSEVLSMVNPAPDRYRIWLEDQDPDLVIYNLGPHAVDDDGRLSDATIEWLEVHEYQIPEVKFLEDTPIRKNKRKRPSFSK